MIKAILVAVDGSEPALRAARLAAELAVKCEAVLHLVQVIAPVEVTQELQEFARSERLDIASSQDVAVRYLLGPAESLASVAGVRNVVRTVLTGDPAECLVDYVRERTIDLAVLGRRGLGPIRGLLMGSVSLKVSSLAECPVLTLK
jgi:nucleotide-binding universal stress UspA family protein